MSPPKEPKGGLALVFGHGEPEEQDKDGDGYDMGNEDLETACDEFLSHLGIMLPDDKKKEACEALKNFVQLVDKEPHEEGSHEEGEGEMPDLGGEE